MGHMERAEQFIGQSLAFLDAVERASRAAPLNRPVLVIGERGTGKELIAERLHHLSSRWAGPLIIMNCAALPENLIEAELFGHEAGSFTGAAKTRHGRFEEADGGTLFLDELGTLSMPAQDRLLRAVEYGEITRIGASKPITSTSASSLRRTRTFPPRSIRASSAPTCSTACRSRSSRCRRSAPAKGDVPLLADHFGRRMAVELDWPNWPGFTPRAVAELEAYPWPGNVRELRNVIERAVYRHEDPERAIDEIIFDPFHSPWAPTAAAGVTARDCRAAIPMASRASVAPAGPIAAAASVDQRLSRGGRRLTSASCSRRRFSATASTSGRPRPR